MDIEELVPPNLSHVPTPVLYCITTTNTAHALCQSGSKVGGGVYLVGQKFNGGGGGYYYRPPPAKKWGALAPPASILTDIVTLHKNMS